MTLLFFIRSPAGNTDTGAAPSAPGGPYDPRDFLRVDRAIAHRKKKEGRKTARMAAQTLAERKKNDDQELARMAEQSLHEAFAEEERQQRHIAKKRKEEELIRLLLEELDANDD